MRYETSAEPGPPSEAEWRGRNATLEAPPGDPGLGAPGGTVSLVGPVLLVVGVLIGLPMAYGASLRDALLYLGYEVGYAVVPGWLLYRALSHRPGGWLRQLALGWGLGYVLQVLAFMLTAWAGARDLFVAYPLVVGIPAALVILRRGAVPRSRDSIPVDLRWLIAGVCIVASAYVAVAYFPIAPLPGTQAVRYHPDLSFAISLAADAKHHWPIQDPNVAGLSMPYHYFVHVHLASASQVTGLDLPVIFLRLYTLPLIVLTTLQLVVAGQSLARSAYAGLVAACLVLLVGQMNLNHETALGFISFLGVLPTYLYGSPSVPFGLVLLVPLLILIGEAISSPREATHVGDWVVMALFMVGASDAKVVILPMVVAALFLFGAARLLTRRRLSPAVWIAGGLATAVFAVLYLLQYRGHSSGVELDPSAGVTLFNEMMIAVAVVKPHLQATLPTFPGSGVLLSTGGIMFGAIGLFSAQLIGLVWLLGQQHLRVNKRQAWLLAFLGVGIVVPLVSHSPGTGNVLYFLAYGTVAGCILAAQGLQLAWRSRPRLDRDAANRGVVLALTGLGILAAAIIIPARLFSAADPDGFAKSYVWAYSGLAAGLIVLLLIGGRWFPHGRWVAALVATSVLTIAGALDRPIESARGGVRTVEAVRVGHAMTPELNGAMEWIRDNTPEDAVIAVNNAEALEFGYAAFSERRTFLGGWAYSLPMFESGFASMGDGLIVGRTGAAGRGLVDARARLNDNTFRDADPRAISELQDDHGVQYLVVDERNGHPADLQALREVARPVYEAPGVTVLELDP